MVILIGIVFANYRVNSSQLALQRSAYRLLGDIRKAQGMAGIDAGCSGVYNYGYGLNINTFSTQQYRLFADCNSDKQWSGTLETKETVTLESGVKICSLKIGTSNQSVVNLVFLPPDPFTLINLVKDSTNDLQITLCLESDASQDKVITINRVGMISIQ